jgi:hypothetical protein
MHPETRTRTAKRENSTLKRKTEGVKANQKKRFRFLQSLGPIILLFQGSSLERS